MRHSIRLLSTVLMLGAMTAPALATSKPPHTNGSKGGPFSQLHAGLELAHYHPGRPTVQMAHYHPGRPTEDGRVHPGHLTVQIAANQTRPGESHGRPGELQVAGKHLPRPDGSHGRPGDVQVAGRVHPGPQFAGRVHPGPQFAGRVHPGPLVA